MEINQGDLEIGESSPDFTSVCIKEESGKRESESSDVEIITEANNFCAIQLEKERHSANQSLATNNENSANDLNNLNTLSTNINTIDHSDVDHLNNSLSDHITLGPLETELINEEIKRRMSQATEVFIGSEEQIQANSYNIPTVSIPSEFLEGLNLNIKRETTGENENTYTTEWLCDVSDEASDTGLKLKISKGGKQTIESPIDLASAVTPIAKTRVRTISGSDDFKVNEIRVDGSDRSKKRFRTKSKLARQDYRERLRRKAECMREKRRKLYDQETEEQKLERLAKEAAKRREMRMYYETPDQRRKRLDAEAARKREYRMYNETPDERRKRLDREAERRRVKRMSLYTNETPEQRRERLNRESAKRREARLNQYAKETEDERRERLRRDALRAREMRFTRSAIETEEERRQRLVKDALRKRELRMHGGHSVSHFTELQTVRSFEELNNVQMRDDPDNQLGSHYLSNWMMWFQNTLTQPVHIGEQNIEPQLQNNG